jgi:cell division septation protein DedD
MTAGDSASEQARRFSEISGVYENKAEWASIRSANFAAGAAGEKALAEAFAPLTAKGWHQLYDRASPNGGNIDLFAVGPAPQRLDLEQQKIDQGLKIGLAMQVESMA